MAIINGTTAADLLNGTAVADQINGFEGNDTIFGEGGDDLLNGGTGNDVLDGGIGVDTLAGGAGDDSYWIDLDGEEYSLIENLGEGTDIVVLAAGVTSIDLPINIENVDASLGAGVFIHANNSANWIRGSAGSDFVFGLGGNDSIEAAGGDDEFQSGGGNDYIDGGPGNDTFDWFTSSGDGADTFIGGSGHDKYWVTDPGTIVVEAANGGNDQIMTLATIVLAPDSGVESIVGAQGADGVNITGSNSPNYISSGLDNLDDNIYNGMGGADTMSDLRGGNDTFFVDNEGDIIVDRAGSDIVKSSITYTLPLANVDTYPVWLEHLTLIGDDAINGTGNDIDNLITGNSAKNILNGGSGDDTLNGGGGNDTLVWHAADGRVNGQSGTDSLRIDGSGVTIDLTAIADGKILNVELIKLTGSGNNALWLSVTDVLAINGADTLRILGNSGDVVHRGGGWTQGVNQVIGSDTYRTYTQDAATLLVDTNITTVV